MELHLTFLAFLGTLRETQKTILKNGKLMASIAMLTLLLNTLLYFHNIFFTKPFMGRYLKEQNLVVVSTPGSPEFTYVLFHLIPEFTYVQLDAQNLAIFFGLHSLYQIINSIFSLFISTLTIVGSVTVICEGNNLITIKNLVQKSQESWKRSCLTLFFTIISFSCILYLLIFPLRSIVYLTSGRMLHVYFILIGCSPSILYVQMSVVWTLALVISTLEEINGLKAIRKAAQIWKKGMILHGFLLNLVFTAIFSIIAEGIRWINGVPQYAEYLLINTIGCLVRIVWLVSYTLYFYQCKKLHGDEIQLEGSAVENSQLITDEANKMLDERRPNNT